MRLLDNQIFLPTRGRLNRQLTLRVLPEAVLQNLTIVCHPGEEEFLEDMWGSQVHGVVPIAASSIGEVRQRCIDMAYSDYITFVDDSLDFHTRAPSERGQETLYPMKGIKPKHYSPETMAHNIFKIFRWINMKLKTDVYGMVGISRRSSNAYHLDETEVLNDRICSFWGINRKLFRALRGNPKFSDFPIKEDFYIQLHFLTNGIPTITSYQYGYGRLRGSNSEGGCSLYRNLDLSNEVAHLLHQEFPDFTILVEKSVKSWNGVFKEQVKALDVKLQSKKAYEYGRRNYTNVLREDNT